MEQARDKKYTYTDYLSWDDGNRYELIDGVPYMLAAPSVLHQRVFRGLFRQFANYLVGKSCEVFSAPFDVVLDADDKADTVIQPDITVVCDPTKVENGKSCKGAPDLVVEVLSPSTAIRDQNIKFDKYLESGVKEYWVVDPETKKVRVYIFERGKGTFQVYTDTDMVPVHIFEGCEINLTEVFLST